MGGKNKPSGRGRVWMTRKGVGSGSFKKIARKQWFCAKIHNFFVCHKEKIENFLENVLKRLNPSVRWSENGFREGYLLRGKSAYGYPPPSPTYGLDILGISGLLQKYTRQKRICYDLWGNMRESHTFYKLFRDPQSTPSAVGDSDSAGFVVVVYSWNYSLSEEWWFVGFLESYSQ